MSTPRSLILLPMLIVPLTVWAALVTLLVPNVYGPEVNASILEQGRGQDLVTLCFAIPVTFISLFLTFRGSMRGYLLLLGQLMYFAYTYLTATVLYPPNPMFIVHVVIFSASFFALLRGLTALEMESLPALFSNRLPRRTIAGYLAFAGIGVGLLWIGSYVVPTLTPGMDANAVLGEDGPNLIVQVLDLGVIVPLSLITAVLLWRGRPWGYALAGMVLVKAATMLLAILGMILAMVQAGQQVALEQVLLFGLLTVGGLVMLGLYIFALNGQKEE